MKTMTILALAALASGSAFAGLQKSSDQQAGRAAPVAQRSGSGSAYSGGTSSGGSMGPTTFGFGISTISLVEGSPTISGLVNLGNQFSVQPMVAVHSTQGGFTFEAGALGKYRVMGSQDAGLHMGGGFNLGSIRGGGAVGGKNVFAVAIRGLVGIYAAMPGLSKLQFHLDAGPQLAIVDGDASFALSGLSPALGLSAFYVF